MVRDALARRGLEVQAVAQVSSCPEERVRRSGLWADPGDLDARVVSYGEVVDLEADLRGADVRAVLGSIDGARAEI